MLSISFAKNEVFFQLQDQDNENSLKSYIFDWLLGMYKEDNPAKDFSEKINHYRLFEYIHEKLSGVQILTDRIYKVYLLNEVYTFKSSICSNSTPIEIIISPEDVS